MKKIAVFFNSPYLGGAERSIIHQAYKVNEKANFSFYIPKLSGDIDNDDEDLRKLINNYFPNSKINSINFPYNLYNISRSGRTKILKSLFLLLKMILLDLHVSIRKYNALWINGNKIGLPILLYTMIHFYKGTFIWHFRDYPTSRGILGKIWKLFKVKKTFNLVLISNSNCVKASVDKLMGGDHLVSKTVYNPTGDLNPTLRPFSKDKIVISIVSMIAPWKGLHNMIVWAAMYEEKLKEIGVNSFNIYGAPIYKTKGEHDNYLEEITKLSKKTSCSLINFCGLKSPQEIYSEIDILIHSSIKPEPFGRIIVEGWKSKKVVFSTGLGGPCELIEDNHTGVIFSPNNYQDLFDKITKIITDEHLRIHIHENALKRLKEIESQIELSLNKIISDDIA